MRTICHPNGSDSAHCDPIDNLSPYKSSDFSLIGQGRRHLVIGCNGEVLRIQKDVSRNSQQNVRGSVEFFEKFTSKYFTGFVCVQQAARCEPRFLLNILDGAQANIASPLWCVWTRNLIHRCTVELKPKCVLIERPDYPPRFVLEQQAREFNPVYDPSPIWDCKDFALFTQSLRAANAHPKRYMKVHKWDCSAPWSPEEVVFMALSSVQGRDLLARLQQLQQYGLDRYAKTIAELLPQTGLDETAQVSPTLDSNVDKFFDTCESSNQKIDTFLAGRMAMDVSLMFNLHSPEDRNKYPDLKPIDLTNGWTCTIGVVDTDLKHRWKIPSYAKQLDCAISACRH